VTAQPKNKGGARPGSGRKKATAPVTIIDGRTVTGTQHAQWLIDQLNAEFNPKKPETIEVAGWRRLWDSLDKRVALETRRYLYDKAKGKAIITVNHVHDKPIEHNINLSLSERFRIAMQKADERLRNSRAG
jgi:tRNA U38,U39,U40 pseudouridine synthase TruA